MRWMIVAAAVLITAAVPFVVAVIAWPEILVPAYFIARGGTLYETIFFPHTPLLILITSLLGQIFGFSAALFRAMVAGSAACCSALIVIGVRPRSRAARGAAIGLLTGVLFYLTCLARVDGFAVWPDPMLAPLILAAALALESFERAGSRTSLGTGALLIGIAILIKQTSGWMAVAAMLWLLMASRRRSLRSVITFGMGVAAPYAFFVIAWAVAYRTWAHVRWTLVIPLLSGHASEIAVVSSEGLLKHAPLYVFVTALAVAAGRLLPAAQRLRTPLPWLIAGSIGMTWPRGDMLHMAAGFGVAAVCVGRAVYAAWLAARRMKRPSSWRSPAAIGIVVIVLVLTVATSFRVNWKAGGPVFFWNDRASRFFAAEVERHVGRGGVFLNFNTQWETLYAITGTTTPSGMYVNPKFWYYLNKEDLGPRLCADLVHRPGTPILFSYLNAEVEDPRSARTCLYQMLFRAPVVRQINPATSWREIPRPSARR